MESEFKALFQRLKLKITARGYRAEAIKYYDLSNN